MKIRLAANAVLNVLAGASGALFAFAVPAFLAGRISAVELSIWSIMLQAAIYVAPFALGIQSVLARHVALQAERAQADAVQQTMAASFRILVPAALAYLLLGGVVALNLGRIYPAIPLDRLQEAELGFFVFAVGQASLIPAAAMTGYFFGLQRNLAITLNLLGSRTLASVAIVVLSTHVNLVALAAAASLLTLAGNAWLYAQYRRSMRKRFGAAKSDRPGAATRSLTLLKECGPISLWTLAHFLIYGGTSTIASATDFANFPAYSMSAAATLALLGFHSAAMNPLIPHVAVVHERGGPAAVARTLERASLVSAGLSALVLLFAALFGQQLISALLPQGVAIVMATVFPILLYSNVLRLLGLPYSCTLLGLGLQGKILWTPVIEAAFSFGFALWLAPRFGLPGVAISIALGAMVSVLMHFLINMRVTRDAVPVHRLRMIVHTLLVLSPAITVVWLMGAWPA